MSRIKQVHIDLLAVLKSINGLDKKPLFRYFNIWDNQIDEMINGDTYSYSTQNACFIEFATDECKMLGMGYSSYPDTIIRFHIVNMLLDGRNGTMEQNLPIFDVRDSVKSSIIKSNISFCSTLMGYEDRPDYKHGNIYKYILSFKTNFIDNKSSVFDTADSGASWGYLQNPDINLNVYNVWFSGSNYFENQSFVSYRDNLYLCSVDNSDEIFTEENWILVNPWIASRQYDINAYVAFENNIYKSNQKNNDSVFDPSKWDLIV